MEKDGDPLGRVVHDYGYFKPGSYSINAAHANTSVRYDSVRRRVLVLDGIEWYIKADLKNGFRQFGTHPADWRFQVYCNGIHEHYIDLACPFGKTNCTLEFCPPVALFAKSVTANYESPGLRHTPRLGSYVDDIFGGLVFSQSLAEALRFRRYICHTGKTLSLEFNMKVNKTPLPATNQVILGSAYDSINRRVRTADKKRKKNISRIETILKLSLVRASEI